jgi:KaiC domain protein
MSDDDWFESGDDGDPEKRPDDADAGDDDWFESGDGKPDEQPVDTDAGGEPSTEDFEAAFDAGSGDEPSTEDFEAALDADAGGEGGPDFDEDFDSDIPRLDLGIRGLDEMIQGGVPERSLMVVMGSAGTGKTTFGLQFLNRGLREDEHAVYITLEESQDAVRQAAVEKGWPFDEYIDDDRLAIVDLDPIEMANSLTSIRGDLPRLIEDFDADRLVLDSVSLLEMMYNDPAKRRTEVFDFTKSLKRAGVTTMVTSEASDTNTYTSKHGIIEYLTDAVFVLQYVRTEFQETRLAVEIQKIRNANHSRETKPYEITGEGISVYRQANIF